jgi:hypothetical protein
MHEIYSQVIIRGGVFMSVRMDLFGPEKREIAVRHEAFAWLQTHFFGTRVEGARLFRAEVDSLRKKSRYPEDRNPIVVEIERSTTSDGITILFEEIYSTDTSSEHGTHADDDSHCTSFEKKTIVSVIKDGISHPVCYNDSLDGGTLQLSTGETLVSDVRTFEDFTAQTRGITYVKRISLSGEVIKTGTNIMNRTLLVVKSDTGEEVTCRPSYANELENFKLGDRINFYGAISKDKDTYSLEVR